MEDRICSEPIYEDRCSYDSYQWSNIVPKIKEGDFKIGAASLILPDRNQFELSNLERISSQKDDFTVGLVFTAPDGTSQRIQPRPQSLSEFTEWRKGEKPTVISNRHGGVLEIKGHSLSTIQH
jgi:hypothetical protein